MSSGILSKPNKKYYITTPIYYVNDAPHIGHTYTTVLADILVRYRRLIGGEAFLLTGTDEHGLKIEEKAQESGLDTKLYVDSVSKKFKSAWDNMNVSYDNFIRTTDIKHIRAVQEALSFLYKKGDIYQGEYEGLYCKGCEQFKAEKDLVDGLCPDHRTAPEKIKEESYMFKMSKYQKEILKKISSDELKILPAERKNEIISFYEQEGLRDVSFSRKNIKWGIPLPWDERHTVYVWADAFLNYLTGLGWSGAPSSAPGDWPPDVQLMSKDILRVHATIWPAMVLALGLALPRILFIHGFFMIGGNKMSKSLGNIISPADMINRYGVDASRYLLAGSMHISRDADISYAWLDEKYSADLANGIGNLVARSIALAERLEESGMKLVNNNAKPENYNGINFSHNVALVWEVYHSSLKNFRPERTLEIIYGSEQINGMVRFLDNYITTTKPWELIKNKDKQAGVVMYNILERLRHTALMISPFMPAAAEKIILALGLDHKSEMQKTFTELVKWGGLPTDTKVKKGEILFPRIAGH